MMFLVFGAAFFVTSQGFVEGVKPETNVEYWILIIGTILMIFVVLGVHELGHLLTGLMQGFTFQLFVVGPLGIKREAEKIKVYFNTNLGFYGGLAATTPTGDHPDNAKKFARILIAGPIASLLLALLCFGVAPYVVRPFGGLLYVGSAISMAIFFATTVPSQTGMFFTDRKRYQRLITPGKTKEIEIALLRIMGCF